jgi:hypothetical protein
VNVPAVEKVWLTGCPYPQTIANNKKTNSVNVFFIVNKSCGKKRNTLIQGVYKSLKIKYKGVEFVLS